MMSVIIPYHNEPFLEKTIASLKENSVGDIEILPIDGAKGMRNAINEGLSKATGEFVMKCDAHCIFGQGFNKILEEDCQEDWLMIPRRYSIDFSTLNSDWKRSEAKPYIDYHFLSFPDLFALNWVERKSDLEIDDTMTYQGSCWVAHRDYFLKHIGYMDENPETYGSFVGEHLEVGLKYWLGGGAIKVNKKTWYGHLHKNRQSYVDGLFSREYKQGSQWKKNWARSSNHWFNDQEKGMIHKLSWLVDKFSPVPTWP